MAELNRYRVFPEADGPGEALVVFGLETKPLIPLIARRVVRKRKHWGAKTLVVMEFGAGDRWTLDWEKWRLDRCP